MNQRKPNIKSWYSLGRAGLLCVLILAIMTGTVFARYRDEKDKYITFTPRVPDQIYIGTVSVVTNETTVDGEVITSTMEVFTPDGQLNWEKKDGKTQLEFSVGNGLSDLDCSAKDQNVRLRMIGSLGIWIGTQVLTLQLVLPPEEEGGEETIITATASPIAPKTALHYEYGDGWIYTFLDDTGEEMYWELAGEELSHISFKITVDGEITEKLVVLQPLVVSEVVQE